MAQDTQKPSSETEQTGSEGRDSRFHYYSGGEIKEQADSRPNSLLYIFYGIVIVGAVFWFLYGGALGPKVGGFKPVGGSQANINALQNELNQTHGATGTYATVDLTQLPIPAGQNINQAISAGSDVYQSYCIGCHGPNQDGNGVNAEELNPKPRNLHDAPFMQAMSYQRITTSVHKGVPGTAMPRWENLLSERQIGDVIAYVFSLTSPAIGAAPAPAAAAENSGAQSGGSKTFENGIQNSPKPITPAIDGNPAAPTTTAPPSQSGSAPPSGPAPDQTGAVAPGSAGTGTEASKPLPPSAPDAGGASVTPPFSPGAATKPKAAVAPKPAAPPKPKAAAPTPGTAAPSGIGANPPNGKGGTGM